LDTFTWKPYSNRKLSHTALNRRIEYESGNEQVQRVSVNPKVVWELKFSGIYSEMVAIKNFFDSHAPGGVLFYWVDEDGTQQTVRFANDTCDLDQKYGIGDDGNFGVQAYECTLQFRKVYV
jgi:phage-related protein